MNDILASIVVLLVGGLLLAVWTRPYTRTERQLMALSFVAHVVATGAQIAITQNTPGGGDLTTYMKEGTLIAKAIELEPTRFGRLWIDLLLQRPPDENLPVFGAGQGTGTMVALAAALALLFRYSLYGSCFTVALLACFGKFALYRALRESVPVHLRTRMVIAALLVPSAVFWSSGIIKEAFVIAGVGPVWLGIQRILRLKPARGALLIAIGSIPIALLKPYTLFALAVAAGAWISVDRLQARAGSTGPVRIRPLYLILGAAVVYGGLIALGRIFPTYSVENLGEDLARHQRLGAMAGGGSVYQMGDEEAMSLSKQILFAPLAIGTSLFRPFVFEANNALALIASVEASVITFLVFQMFVRTGLRRVVRTVMSTPIFVAALVFTLSFGMAVGLATTNFGSLSRYRMPLMPFYLALVLGLGAPAERPATVAKKVASPAATRPTRISRRPPARVRGASG